MLEEADRIKACY